MKIAIISDELYRELNEPSEITVNSINYWLRANIGSLNNLIFTSFALTENGAEITPELNEDEKSILKKLYSVYYYSVQIRANLGAASYDSFVELSQDGDSIKRVNKNELSKSYLQAKKMESEDLALLVRGYKSKAAAPRQVAGDDNFNNSGLSCNDSCFRRL